MDSSVAVDLQLIASPDVWDLQFNSESSANDIPEQEWSVSDSEKLAEFYKKHEITLKSVAKRGEGKRNKLYAEIAAQLTGKYSDKSIKRQLDNFKNWPEGDTMTMIEFYQSRPFMWLPSHPDYHKMNIRDNALEELKLLLSKTRTLADLKSKWTNLVTVWKRKKAAEPKNESGKGRKTAQKDVLYEALDFLKDKEVPTNTMDSLTSTPPPEEHDSDVANSETVQSKENQDGDPFNISSPKSVIAGTTRKGMCSVPNNKRKLDKVTDDETVSRKRLHEKLELALSEKQTSSEAFGASVGLSLEKLSEVGQEFAKIEIQKVLAEFRKRELFNQSLPTFYPEPIIYQ